MVVPVVESLAVVTSSRSLHVVASRLMSLRSLALSNVCVPRRRSSRMATASRVAVAVVAVLVTIGVAAPRASAEVTQGYRYLLNNNGYPLKGSRATVWAPTFSEVTLNIVDFFVTSAFADTGSIETTAAYGIQTGVSYEWFLPNGECTLGNPNPKLYYFVETISQGSFACYVRCLTQHHSARVINTASFGMLMAFGGHTLTATSRRCATHGLTAEATHAGFRHLRKRPRRMQGDGWASLQDRVVLHGSVGTGPIG